MVINGDESYSDFKKSDSFKDNLFFFASLNNSNQQEQKNRNKKKKKKAITKRRHRPWESMLKYEWWSDLTNFSSLRTKLPVTNKELKSFMQA
jgi:hypothetical protein